MPKKLTQKKANELFYYNSLTGIIINKINRGSKAKKGAIAGYINTDGYVMIMVDGKNYLAHCLAWLYVYGYFPENDVDHKDRIKHHNWIDNLREASRSCNMINTGNKKNNTSGVKGVYWDKQRNKWHAQIMVNFKCKYLGIYNHFHNAVCARLAGEQACNWSNCDSSSPAYQYVQNMIGGFNE